MLGLAANHAPASYRDIIGRESPSKKSDRRGAQPLYTNEPESAGQACSVWPSNVLAKPLTKADIEGKKMCWGDDFKIFYPGGKVYNHKVGGRTGVRSKVMRSGGAA
jgi:hypothetical protein